MEAKKFNNSIELADNAMLKHRLDLFYEWDFEKNDSIGLDVYQVTRGSDKKAWWICKVCGSSYSTSIKNKIRSEQCSYCKGAKVNHTNSLAAKNPMLAAEWHPTLNGELTPHDVSCRSNKKIVWQGAKCKHEWKTTVNDRNTFGTGCPYCSYPVRKLLVGFNDMWTTNPKLANQLANPEDGRRYTQFSGRRVDWRCAQCGHIITQKTINHISREGLFCPVCSDGMSFPERFMRNLFKINDIDFKYDRTQDWSKEKRYDFYLPEHNWIVEVHGIQHYIGGYQSLNSRNACDERKNDKLKKNIAKENGISKYIVIDARYSEVQWIRDSVLNSDLARILKNTDFEEAGRLAQRTIVKTASELWESGSDVREIADILQIHRKTVSDYLKRGTEIGWCNYDPKEEMRKNGAKRRESTRKIVVQLTLDNLYIREWSSIREAGESLGITTISEACRGRQKTAGGYKWMYLEEYKKICSHFGTVREEVDMSNYECSEYKQKK